jgi:hypothetical protein
MLEISVSLRENSFLTLWLFNATKTTMAVSIYPKEANPLWGNVNITNTYTKSYSSHTFDYPSESSFGFWKIKGWSIL